MSKHTPGPWFYGDWIKGTKVESSASEWVEIWNIDADGSQGLPFVACKHHDQIANARLIAAAPELLEALKLIASAENSALDLAYCKGIARAAIAKATGGADIDAMEKYGHAAKITVKKLEGV